MVERRIIYKCLVGSKLFGTDRPESDTDYAGVFLPSLEDLCSLNRCPEEWSDSEKVSEGERNTKEDTDCKYFSVQKFFRLLAEGQPGQLEMLFAPNDKIVERSMEWSRIFTNRDLFLSQQGVRPFIGFATAQAHKATIKGENLNKLRAIRDYMQEANRLGISFNIPMSEWYDNSQQLRLNVEHVVNDHGFPVYRVAGRQWDVNLKAKTFLENVINLIDRYGARSDAAAEKGYDFKALSHAIRLLGEAYEFLTRGVITFPRPDAGVLKMIRDGKLKDLDYFEEINKAIEELKLLKSSLPEKPDMKAINELCQDMLKDHLCRY